MSISPVYKHFSQSPSCFAFAFAFAFERKRRGFSFTYFLKKGGSNFALRKRRWISFPFMKNKDRSCWKKCSILKIRIFKKYLRFSGRRNEEFGKCPRRQGGASLRFGSWVLWVLLYYRFIGVLLL